MNDPQVEIRPLAGILPALLVLALVGGLLLVVSVMPLTGADPLELYDANGDGAIEVDEALTAAGDLAAGTIDDRLFRGVWELYLQSRPDDGATNASGESDPCRTYDIDDSGVLEEPGGGVGGRGLRGRRSLQGRDDHRPQLLLRLHRRRRLREQPVLGTGGLLVADCDRRQPYPDCCGAADRHSGARADRHSGTADTDSGGRAEASSPSYTDSQTAHGHAQAVHGHATAYVISQCKPSQHRRR